MESVSWPFLTFFDYLIPLQTLHAIFPGNICISYLAQPCEPYIAQALARLLVKVVKLGWFETVNDELVFRKTVDELQVQ